MLGKERVKEEIIKEFDRLGIDYSYFKRKEKFIILGGTLGRIRTACIEIFTEDWGYVVFIEIPLFIDNDKRDKVSEFMFRYNAPGFELSYKHNCVYFIQKVFCEYPEDFACCMADMGLYSLQVSGFANRLIDILYSDATPQQALDREDDDIRETEYERKQMKTWVQNMPKIYDEEHVAWADAENICDSIKKYLDDKKFKYSVEHDEDYWISIPCKLKNKLNKIELNVRVMSGTYSACSEHPVTVKETALKETAELLNWLNKNILGRFELDYEDNTVYCAILKVYCLKEHSKDFIKLTLDSVIYPMEKYGDIISAVANGECTAAEAVERIEDE